MAGIEVAVAAAVDPGAGGCHRRHRRRRGVDLQGAGRVGHRAGEIGTVACRVLQRCPVQVERRHRQIAGVLSGADRVAEAQCGPGAADVTGRAAIVQRQRRRAAGHRHRLAQVDGQGDDMAGIEVAVAAAVDPGAGGCHRRHRRRRGVDLQGARRIGHRAGEIGTVARRVLQRCPVQVERRHRQIAGVLSGADRVAEAQCGPGAADVTCRAAIVQGQRRRAAGHRHRLAQVDGQGDDMAGIEVAVAAAVDPGAGGCHRRHRRRRGVDLQGAGRVGHRAGEIGTVARRVLQRCPVQVERRHRQIAGVLSGADRVAEAQCGPGAADVTGRAAIVQGQRRRAAGHRHRLAQVDGQGDDMAGIEVAVAAAVDPGAGGCHRRHRRRRGVDLQGARRVGHRAGEIGTVARRVLQRCPVQVERRHRQIAGVLSGADRVAEAQCGPGAADVTRRAAIVQGQRRRAAGHRHRLAQVDGQGDDMAGIEVAVAAAVDPGAGGCHRRHRRRRGVDLQGAGRVGHRACGDNPVCL